MKRCLITGGAGFIGSHLVEKMVKKGCIVTVIDNLSTGSLKNLEKVRNDIEFFNIDIRDEFKLNKIKTKAEVIFHLAALVSVNESILKPKKTFDINFTGTINVLEAAKRLGINKIIFASSSAVYGNINKKKIKENDSVNPISPYGLSKLTAEEALSIYEKLYGFTTVSLRFFNVYGPRQNADSPYSGVISKFMKAFKNGERLTIYGKGNQTRDFIYVEDLVDAIIKSAGVEHGNYIYNVGTGNSISINALVKNLSKIYSKKRIKTVHQKPRRGDILISEADINKIQKQLKFKPRYDIDQGLRKLD